jgi:hypothetical protein
MGVRAVIDKLLFRIGMLAGLALLCGVAQAEYVTDRLQLDVHMQPDASDPSFAKLKSGDRVEILETNRYHALVQMQDGRKGWVKKTYLVTDKPAVLRVAEVEGERDKAVAELESLASSLSDREAQVAEREAGAVAEAEELERLRVDNVSLSGRLEAYSFSVPGTLFFVAVAASLVIGCLLSWRWFDYRSRVRHGGFRIH